LAKDSLVRKPRVEHLKTFTKDIQKLPGINQDPVTALGIAKFLSSLQRKERNLNQAYVVIGNKHRSEWNVDRKTSMTNTSWAK